MRLLPLAFVMLALAPAAQAGTVLPMLEEKWCGWCEQWDREAGVICRKTTGGHAAPLMRHGIHEPLPEAVMQARRTHCTPTFALLRDRAELGRIEGHPGWIYLWPALEAAGGLCQETRAKSITPCQHASFPF